MAKQRKAKKLSEIAIEKARPEPKPYIMWDAATTGLGLKVLPTGKKVWVEQLVYPGATVQTKKTLGYWPALGLGAARRKAEEWYSAAKSGTDPAIAEQKAAEAEQRAALLAKEHTFAAVLEAFRVRALAKQRRGDKVYQRLTKECAPAWGKKHIGEIDRADVVALIEKIVDRTKTGSYARNVLQDISAVFGFAIERGTYGLAHSPTDRIKPAKLIGKKTYRTRVLSDDELARLWQATGDIGYPFARA
jgi:hypothetical protein